MQGTGAAPMHTLYCYSRDNRKIAGTVLAFMSINIKNENAESHVFVLNWLKRLGVERVNVNITPPVNSPCVLSTYLRDKCDAMLKVGKKSVCTFMMDFAFFAGLPF